MVVDDQPGILLLLTDVLESEGYHITTAKTGQEALDTIRNQMFDLIILDYRLPIVDGMGVVQQLEREQIAIPIIIMSGLTEKITTAAKQYSQIVAILAKPFDITGLSELVKENIESYN